MFSKGCTGKKWAPPPGRIPPGKIRTAIALILRDLSDKSMRFSAQQRFKLHERVAALQNELRALEIERLEEEAQREHGEATDKAADNKE